MKRNILFILTGLILFSSCKKDNSVPPDTTLAVTAISPATGVYGTEVTITGKNFSTTAANSVVKVNGVTIPVTSATATQLKIIVPPKTGTGAVTVQTGTQTANGPVWTHIYQATVSTLAGSGTAGYADGTGANAQFNFPSGITTDALGNVYVGDRFNFRIRKITPDGVVTTFAGDGTSGLLNGAALLAKFTDILDLKFDVAGNLYVADASNNRIRKIAPDGMVSTFTGTGSGSVDGPVATAKIDNPMAMAFDNTGTLHAFDYKGKIRKIAADGSITTLAGSGIVGYVDGNGSAAQLYYSNGMTVDANNNLFITQPGYHTIRKITPSADVTTYAGVVGVQGSQNGPITTAKLKNPRGIGFIGSNIVVAGFREIRFIDVARGEISLFAGSDDNGTADGSATIARFQDLNGLCVYNNSIIYVCDDYRIRKIVLE